MIPIPRTKILISVNFRMKSRRLHQSTAIVSLSLPRTTRNSIRGCAQYLFSPTLDWFSDNAMAQAATDVFGKCLQSVYADAGILSLVGTRQLPSTAFRIHYSSHHSTLHFLSYYYKHLLIYVMVWKTKRMQNYDTISSLTLSTLDSVLRNSLFLVAGRTVIPSHSLLYWGYLKGLVKCYINPRQEAKVVINIWRLNQFWS
jgi:hypothetical protein